MKSAYLLIVVLLIASGYFSYREGYLAGVHPLLDPSAKIVVTREGDGAEKDELSEEEEEEKEEPAVAGATETEEVEVAPPAEATPADEPEISEKELARMERAEEARLAKEARDAERAAVTAAREAEYAARREHNDLVNKAISDLERQSTELQSQLRAAQRKMSDQEGSWRQERIKTREAEKQQLREAAQAYEAQLRAQIDLIYQDIRQKRRELK